MRRRGLIVLMGGMLLAMMVSGTAFAALYNDEDARAALNGLINEALWQNSGDDETIAQMRVAGLIYRAGSSTAMDLLNQ
jgi:hypothetical protein